MIEHYKDLIADTLRKNGFETPEDFHSVQPLEITKERILFLCDGEKCADGSCKHGGECKYTSDITHAKNFTRIGDSDVFVEEPDEDIQVPFVD